jgi:NAD(P)-dependent dehydrogenase (short-subunit alcohol dehydrogenase family)
MIADIDDAAANKSTNTIGDGAIPFHLDVTKEEHWQQAVTYCLDQFKRLDIVVNCAGIGVSGDFEETDLSEWNNMIAVNLTGVMLGCKHGIKGMKAGNTGGSIINLSSLGGLIGAPDVVGYCATKGGVTLLTKSVALYCAQHKLNIRCNSVHPTYVDSEMLDPIAEMFGSREAMITAMATEVPIGRIAIPQDIANAILFLSSDESAMITGSPLIVDGGQAAGVMGKHSGP